MANKVDELTSKIYQEGVTKANQEAEKIINDAKKQAEDIVNKANKEADTIKQQAEEEAQDKQRKVENELKQAYQQTLRRVQQAITDLIVAKVSKEPLKDTFKDTDFIKKIIETALQNWAKDESQVDLTVLVPEDQKKELDQYFEGHTKELLNGTLTIEVDPDMKAGFKIGPADGSYQISFEEDDFRNLFQNYLRPRTIKMLFGDQ